MEMSDKRFEMPQSLAKTASFFIGEAYKEFAKNHGKPRS